MPLAPFDNLQDTLTIVDRKAHRLLDKDGDAGGYECFGHLDVQAGGHGYEHSLNVEPFDQ